MNEVGTFDERVAKRSVTRVCTAAAMAVLIAACGTSTEEPSPAAPTVAEQATTAAPTTTAPTTTAPPTTEPPPDFDAIYRDLHADAVAYLADPLGLPPGPVDCERSLGACIDFENQARDGLRWQGMGPDNLRIDSVEVLEELSPDRVDLKVVVSADEPVELVDADGAVIDSYEVPSGATRRLRLTRRDGSWRFGLPVIGRWWQASAETAEEEREPFDLHDPLDEVLEPTGEKGTTEDGLFWQAYVTDDRFCLRVETPTDELLLRCITEPERTGDAAFRLQFIILDSGEYLAIWFAYKVTGGYAVFEDGSEQVEDLFIVDTSDLWDGVILRAGVWTIKQRPEAVSALVGDERWDPIEFDWPVPNDGSE